MTISELIKALEEAEELHGDVPVKMPEPNAQDMGEGPFMQDVDGCEHSTDERTGGLCINLW